MAKTDSSHPDNLSQPHYLIHSANDKFRLEQWMDICPHSQCMTAYDLDLKEQLLYALPCNRWSCRHCAQRKTRYLAYKTEKAKPQRLLTLTVDPKNHANPRAAFDETRRKIPDLIKFLRTRYGEVEYLKVTELHKSGYPHYHFLMRSGYLPHPVVRDAWFQLTGASIVDLRQVKSVFNTYTYLLKYLTKMHHIEWTGRHVSYSRGFFPKETDPKFVGHELWERELLDIHPSTYIMTLCPGSSIELVTPRSYRITAPGPRSPRPPQQRDFLRAPKPDPDQPPEPGHRWWRPCKLDQPLEPTAPSLPTSTPS